MSLQNSKSLVLKSLYQFYKIFECCKISQGTICKMGMYQCKINEE